MDEYDQKWIARVLDGSSLDASGCVLYLGYTHPNYGYGETHYRGKSVRVHRKIFELHHGVALTRWQFVCHSCDVRNCIAISHL